MAETPRPPELSAIPSAVAAPKRKWSVQLVWVVPIVAALAGGWFAVQAILKKGPTITISFESANGIESGKTQIKYKEVQIGLVTNVAFSEGGKRVIATAEMNKQAEQFLTEDAQFWVVSPRVTLSSVSGLGTLFSGVYIGMAPGHGRERRREFIGLNAPPVLTADQPGRQFTVKSDTLGSLDIGSPIYFRQVRVGQVITQELNKDGSGVTLKIFIDAPYDRFVKARTRFWQASGFDVSLNASGLTVNTESLIALLIGGLAFQTPVDALDASEAAPDTTFDLYRDRASAMRTPDTVITKYRLAFRESVRGLSVGAPVDFRGITVGEVTAIGVEFDPKDKQVLILVDVDVYPMRLRSRAVKGPVEPQAGYAVVEAMVSHGMRAQLRTGNLLTGQLYIAVDFFHDVRPAKLDTTQVPPLLPTLGSPMTEIQTSIGNVLHKIERMPLDELSGDLRNTLKSLDRTLADVGKLTRSVDTDVTPELKSTLVEARRTLDETRRLLAAESPARQELQDMLREITRAAQAMRSLADMLERQPEALIRGKKETNP